MNRILKRSSIRRSTDQDLAQVHTWLIEENEQGVHGNFLCNWRVIDRAHKNRNLLVYIDGAVGQPVGFQLGGLLSPGILQVRNSFRGKGIGRKLVERCFSLANKRNEPCLLIQCIPSSSILFWKKMGFTLLDKNRYGEHYAYRVVNKSHRLPEQGTDIDDAIAFYPESRRWEVNEKPYSYFSPSARIDSDGVIHLGQRVIFHEKTSPKYEDVLVGMEISGEPAYLDKAKYQQTRDMGVERCQNGYYIDLLRVS